MTRLRAARRASSSRRWPPAPRRARAPGDHPVDPRALVAALARAARAGRRRAAARDRGGHADRPVAGRVGWRRRRVTGLPVRPVKGQVLRLREPDGPGPASTASSGYETRSTSCPAATAGTSSGRRWRSAARHHRHRRRRARLLHDGVDLVPGLAEYGARGGERRAAPRHPGQRADPRAAARRPRRAAPPPVITATASCSPRSPPT